MCMNEQCRHDYVCECDKCEQAAPKCFLCGFELDREDEDTCTVQDKPYTQPEVAHLDCCRNEWDNGALDQINERAYRIPRMRFC